MGNTATRLFKKPERCPEVMRLRGPGPRASGVVSAADVELRILLFSPLFPEYAVRLGRSLAKHASVRLITDRTGYDAECGDSEFGRQVPSQTQCRLYQLFLRRSGVLATIQGLLGALIDTWTFRPHIVHFQECPNIAHYLLVLVMKRSARLVITVHDPLPHSGRDSKLDRPMIRRRIRVAADLLLAHGEHCCRELARLTGVRGAEVRETTHGVVLCPHAALLREPIPGRVLLFGRMEHYKGLSVLLDAVEILGRRGIDLTLHLAGRGPELDRLAGRCQRGNITVRDKFLTPSEAAQEFQEACIVALPYLDATQSGVVSAAFANGRPVVASRVGGLTDVVIDGANGLLAEPGQPESLANALERALSSPELLARLRQGARRTAATDMDWDAISSRTVGYYRELLERSRAR